MTANGREMNQRRQANRNYPNKNTKKARVTNKNKKFKNYEEYQTV